MHVLDKGETLLSVAKRYSIKVEEVMRWNGITDVRQCFAGMNLIVRKADPDAPTDAEKLLLQKEKRLEMQERRDLARERVIKSELEWVRTEIPRLMAGVAQLRAPLLAEIGFGPNWEQSH